MIGIILAIALSQTPDSTVAVIFREGTVIMKRSQAEAQLKATKDRRLRAALELALMVRSHHCDHTPRDSEVECFDR